MPRKAKNSSDDDDDDDYLQPEEENGRKGSQVTKKSTKKSGDKGGKKTGPDKGKPSASANTKPTSTERSTTKPYSNGGTKKASEKRLRDEEDKGRTYKQKKAKLEVDRVKEKGKEKEKEKEKGQGNKASKEGKSERAIENGWGKKKSGSVTSKKSTAKKREKININELDTSDWVPLEEANKRWILRMLEGELLYVVEFFAFVNMLMVIVSLGKCWPQPQICAKKRPRRS